MSRRPQRRPIGWRVGECLWSPRRKDNGTKWGFWETMLGVRRGDVVFHLCGGSRKAEFTGFSVADEDGQAIDQGPLGPEGGSPGSSLKCYTPFEKAIVWDTVRVADMGSLRVFSENKSARGSIKERLFYVQQGGKLQCLDGTYLSFLSDELIEILFGFRTERNRLRNSSRFLCARGYRAEKRRCSHRTTKVLPKCKKQLW